MSKLQKLPPLPLPVRLDPKVWLPRLNLYATAVVEKRALESRARVLAKQAGEILQQFVVALGEPPAPTALVGNTLVAHQTTPPVAPSLTLADGSRVAWEDVDAVIIQGRRVSASQVASLFGGRCGSQSLVIQDGQS